MDHHQDQRITGYGELFCVVYVMKLSPEFDNHSQWLESPIHCTCKIQYTENCRNYRIVIGMLWNPKRNDRITYIECSSIADANSECRHNYCSSNQLQLYDVCRRIEELELWPVSDWNSAKRFLENEMRSATCTMLVECATNLLYFDR